MRRSIPQRRRALEPARFGFGAEASTRCGAAHSDSIAHSKERLATLMGLTGDYETSDPPAENLEALRAGIRKWAG